MPYRYRYSNAATECLATTRRRTKALLVVGLFAASSATFAAESTVTAPALAAAVTSPDPSSMAGSSVMTTAPVEGSSSADGTGVIRPDASAPQEPSTQFIPYSMAAQAAARSEPVAAARDPVAKPKVAASLSAYVADRWSIGRDQASRLVDMAHRVAAEHALDPLLLLAVAARESGFQYTGNAGSLDAEPNPKKVDPGTAHGLMQVAGRFHPDKMPVDSRGRMRVTTDEENLTIGAQLLRENLSLDQGDVGRALQRYNGNLRDAGQRFARYVLKVRRDLQRVIRTE